MAACRSIAFKPLTAHPFDPCATFISSLVLPNQNGNTRGADGYHSDDQGTGHDPEEYRDYLQIAPGDRVDFAFGADGTVQLVAMHDRRRQPLSDKFDALVGSRSNMGNTAELMNMLRGYSDDENDPGFR